MDGISAASAEARGVEISACSVLGGERALGLYAADRVDEHFPAQVLRRESGFYLLNLNSTLRKGRKLIMREGHVRFELEVLSSQPHAAGGFAVGCKVVACRKGDVRQEWRLAVNQSAKVTLLLSRKTYPARVKDCSPFGMGIELPADLEKGTAISIRTRDGIGHGEVRYSRPLPDGKYFTGLYLQEFAQRRDRFLRRFSNALHRTRMSLAHSWRRLWRSRS